MQPSTAASRRRGRKPKPRGETVAPVAVPQLDRAVPELSQLAHDGQSQPAASRVAIAGLVEAREPLEDPLTIGVPDPGPVVGHVDDDAAAVAVRGDGDPAVRVPDGVVDEI